MTTPLSEPHAHVLDPTWTQQAVPWADTADPTMVARIHAACMDDCWDCLTVLARATAASAETTTVVMAMGFSVYVMLPSPMRATVEEKLAYAPAFMTLLRRIQDSGDVGISAPEMLDMVRALDVEDRWQVTDAAIQLMGLYTQVMQDKEGER